MHWLHTGDTRSPSHVTSLPRSAPSDSFTDHNQLTIYLTLFYRLCIRQKCPQNTQKMTTKYSKIPPNGPLHWCFKLIETESNFTFSHFLLFCDGGPFKNLLIFFKIFHEFELLGHCSLICTILAPGGAIKKVW